MAENPIVAPVQAMRDGEELPPRNRNSRSDGCPPVRTQLS